MQELKKRMPVFSKKSKSRPRSKSTGKFVTIGSHRIKESELQKMIKSLSLTGPDPYEGLISKITLVLNGETQVLETLNDQELEIMNAELSAIRHLKEDHPSEVDS